MSGEFEAVIEWLRKENVYRQERLDPVKVDELWTGDDPFVANSRWRRELATYMHRAYVITPQSLLGRQALMKYVSTSVALGESVWRRFGEPPPPGLPSGVTDPDRETW